MSSAKKRKRQSLKRKEFVPVPGKVYTNDDPEFKPDWETPCEVCGERPTMPLTGMCGPCTTGEAETYGGNW